MIRSVLRAIFLPLGGPRRTLQMKTPRGAKDPERVLVGCGYASRWRTFRRIQWWLRLLPVRLQML